VKLSIYLSYVCRRKSFIRVYLYDIAREKKDLVLRLALSDCAVGAAARKFKDLTF